MTLNASLRSGILKALEQTRSFNARLFTKVDAKDFTPLISELSEVLLRRGKRKYIRRETILELVFFEGVC